MTYKVQQRGKDMWAVLGPNPDHNKESVPFNGSHITVCKTDGQNEAEMIADALNSCPRARNERGWI